MHWKILRDNSWSQLLYDQNSAQDVSKKIGIDGVDSGFQKNSAHIIE